MVMLRSPWVNTPAISSLSAFSAFSARALETAFQHRDHTNPFELVLQNLTDSDADLPGHGAGLPEE